METTFLVSYARTGSHMLQHALARHPALRTCERCLSAVSVDYSPELRQLVYEECGHEITDDQRIVPKHLFNTWSYLDRVRANFDFCKLHYIDIAPHIQEYLQDKKVIHLVRDNHLAMLLSWHVAARSGNFLPSDDKPIDWTPVKIEVQELKSFTVHYWQYAAPWADRFTIKYHDLVHNWSDTIRQVQEYIGVHPLPLQPVTTKRVDRPLRELILNWQELEDAGYRDWLNGD
jgi:hypothetical protein